MCEICERIRERGSLLLLVQEAWRSNSGRVTVEIDIALLLWSATFITFTHKFFTFTYKLIAFNSTQLQGFIYVPTYTNLAG